MLGVAALDSYWTGIYQAESRVFRTTGLPTTWENSFKTSHIDNLPDNITNYLEFSAQWAEASESWEPEVSEGTFGWGVKYQGYQSSIVIHNKETQPVVVQVGFDSQITGASGWTVPLTGLRDGDSISPQAWSGTATFTIPVNGYQFVKITNATVQISGCMDSTADNYNPDATVSDASCEYRGCTDSQALNYDSSANVDDGSCIDKILGCTDASALNYDSTANQDDGSCVYEPAEVAGCTDSQATNYDSTATADDGSCVYEPATEVAGCTDSTATNYDSTATQDDGSCVYDNDDGNQRVVGYTHTVSEVAERTASSPWLFATLGLFAMAAGTYYFTRE
jgi:hypothetical protein